MKAGPQVKPHFRRVFAIAVAAPPPAVLGQIHRVTQQAWLPRLDYALVFEDLPAEVVDKGDFGRQWLVEALDVV